MAAKKAPPRKPAKASPKAGAGRAVAIKRKESMRSGELSASDKNARTSKRGRVNEGRPTKYQPIYAELAHKAALLGVTDSEMAPTSALPNRRFTCGSANTRSFRSPSSRGRNWPMLPSPQACTGPHSAAAL